MPSRDAVRRFLFTPGGPGVLYFASALFVLAGGYLRLHDASGHPTSVALRDVLGTSLAYQAALVLVLAGLRRIGTRGDVLAILGVLSVFLLDLTLDQHLYGWGSRDGRVASLLGSLTGLLAIAAVARLLDLPAWSRLFAGFAAFVLFIRWAPGLLAADRLSGATVAASPRFVLLGWVLAAALLAPLLLPTVSRARSRLPLAAMEGIALPGGALLLTLHFVCAGESFDLPFRAAYLAPVLVALAPVLDAARARGVLEPPARRLADALPYLGALAAAASVPPPFLEAPWRGAGSFAPFYPALILAAAVETARARYRREPLRTYGAAGILALAVLGGDLPEALAAARFPSHLQALAVAALLWAPALVARHAFASALAHAGAAFVLASSLDGLGYPWTAGFVTLLALGLLAMEAVGVTALAPRSRLVAAAIVAFLPLVAAAFDATAGVRVAVWGGSLGLLVALAALRRDRAVAIVAGASLGTGVLLLPLVFQVARDVPLGNLLAEIGFALLPIAFVRSLRAARRRSSPPHQPPPSPAGEPAGRRASRPERRRGRAPRLRTRSDPGVLPA